MRIPDEGIHMAPRIVIEYELVYPVIMGHALTIAKAMGSTIPHVTLYMEEISAPAAGYVALTRVKSLDDVLLIGHPSTRFFHPTERAL